MKFSSQFIVHGFFHENEESWIMNLHISWIEDYDIHENMRSWFFSENHIWWFMNLSNSGLDLFIFIMKTRLYFMEIANYVSWIYRFHEWKTDRHDMTNQRIFMKITSQRCLMNCIVVGSPCKAHWDCPDRPTTFIQRRICRFNIFCFALWEIRN